MRRIDTQSDLRRAMHDRPAFTLVEMLVVIGILLAVTAMVVVTFRPGEGDKMRTAGRIAQSAILGAKDRAIHAKERRGFRIILDPNDANVGIGFVYLQPLPKQVIGQPAGATMTVCRPDADNNQNGIDATQDTPIFLLIDGADGQTIRNLDVNGMMGLLNTRIQIPSSNGKLYTPVVQSTTPPYYTQIVGTRTMMTLTANVAQTSMPFPNVVSLPSADASASAEFDLDNELTPNQQIIPLTSGIVIDLSPNRSSQFAKADFMYSPRGMINGPMASAGLVSFLLRDVRDVTEGIDPANVAVGVTHRENMIVTLNPQTGHCQTYPIDQTDVLDNATGNAGLDGIADDLFHFARIGSAAGQ